MDYARVYGKPVSWVTARGAFKEIRRRNRGARRHGRRIRVAVPLPFDRYTSWSPGPITPPNMTVVPKEEQRPPYWPTLGDCLTDLTVLDAALRKSNRRAVVHIWLPMKDVIA